MIFTFLLYTAVKKKEALYGMVDEFLQSFLTISDYRTVIFFSRTGRVVLGHSLFVSGPQDGFFPRRSSRHGSRRLIGS